MPEEESRENGQGSLQGGGQYIKVTQKILWLNLNINVRAVWLRYINRCEFSVAKALSDDFRAGSGTSTKIIGKRFCHAEFAAIYVTEPNCANVYVQIKPENLLST